MSLDQAKRMQESFEENKRLRKENKKLRDALAPFACLGRNELTQGDFNRARRALTPPMRVEDSK